MVSYSSNFREMLKILTVDNELVFGVVTFLPLTGVSRLRQVVESDHFQLFLVHVLLQCSLSGVLSLHHSADLLLWVDITVGHCPPPLSRSVVGWLLVSVGDLTSLSGTDRGDGRLRTKRTRRRRSEGSRITLRDLTSVRSSYRRTQY